MDAKFGEKPQSASGGGILNHVRTDTLLANYAWNPSASALADLKSSLYYTRTRNQAHRYAGGTLDPMPMTCSTRPVPWGDAGEHLPPSVGSRGCGAGQDRSGVLPRLDRPTGTSALGGGGCRHDGAVCGLDPERQAYRCQPVRRAQLDAQRLAGTHGRPAL
jgi:hypothetical protein